MKRTLLGFNFVCLISLAGCASAPLVVQIPATVASVKPNLTSDSDYKLALDAIAWALWTDLQLPATTGVVTFYPNRFDLESALAQNLEQDFEERDQQGALLLEAARAKFWDGIEKRIENEPEQVKRIVRAKAAEEFEQKVVAQFERTQQAARAKRDQEIAFVARQKSVTVVALTGFGRVIVNQLILDKYTWPDRLKILAHELAHLVQLGLVTGRMRTMSLPERAAEVIEKRYSSNSARPGLWLTEGFAEWVGYKVLNTFDVQTFSKSREYVVDQIEIVRHYQTFPALAQLVKADDWQAWTSSLGLPATYGKAFLAMESLIDQKGLAAIIDYFRLFSASNDHENNFVAAFGETASAFEENFDNSFNELLQK